MIKKRRFEQKFLVPLPYVRQVKEILSHTCVCDRRYEEDTVCSLYFDSRNLHAFNEVLNGDIRKSKLRLRWYELSSAKINDPVDAYLEIKSKEGFRGHKRREKIRLTQELFRKPMKTENYLTPDFFKALIEIGWKEKSQFFPIMLIKYKRARFWDILSGLRFCFDYGLKVTHINNALINAVAPVDVNKSVLEIKGTTYHWPKTLKILAPFSLRGTSFSKYAYCLESCRLRPEFYKNGI